MSKQPHTLEWDTHPLKSAALAHGKQSFGAKLVKKGFSFSDEMDLAWALGFPRMHFLYDGHPDDGDPEQHLADWWKSALMVPERIGAMSLWPRWGEWEKRAHDPIEPGNVGEVLRVHLWGTSAGPSLYRGEALAGTEPVVDALLAVAETKMRDGDIGDVSRLWYLLLFLPLLLLRLPAKGRTAALERLEAIGRGCDDGSTNATRVRQAIDGAFDRGDHDEYCRRATIHGNRADELIENARTQSLGSGGLVEGRDAWIAGDAIVEIMRGRWKKANGDARWAMMEQYGWIKSEQTVLLFADMFSSKNLKPSLETWFVQRVDYARPILVDTEKAGGALGKSAAKVLKHLDKTLGAG